MRQRTQYWNQIGASVRRTARRWLSVLVCAALTISLLPLTAQAADDRNLCALQVTTGASAGSGVTYFAVVYQGTDGVERTEYIFPNQGDYQRSLQYAASFGVTEKGEQLAQDFHYQTKDWSALQPLQPYQTDTYFFQPGYPLDKLVRVEVFGTGSTWICQSLQVYQVDSVQGLDFYGYLSNQYYVRFSGTRLAELQSAEGVLSFAWQMSTSYSFPLDADSSSGAAGKLVSANASYTSDTQTTCYLKLDIADVYQGGVEALTTELTDKQAGLTSLGLCEVLAATVQYTDTDGSTRQFTMPVLLSSLEWAIHEKNVAASSSVAGVAQQGEQILVPLVLPNYREIQGLTLYYGHSNAVTAAEMTSYHLTDRQKQRASQIDSTSAPDTMNITGVSLYDAAIAKPELSVDGGFLRGTLNSSVPTDFYTASTQQGNIMKTGDRWQVQLKIYQKGDLLTPKRTSKQYLVTIKTDSTASAGTTGDLLMQLEYQTLSGESVKTESINVRERVTEFYGYWPSSSGRSSFAYLQGVSAGGTMQFQLSLNDVYRFTGASFTLRNSNGDDWQMEELHIYELSSLDARNAEWETVTVGSSSSDRSYTRSFTGQELLNLTNSQLLLQGGTDQNLQFDKKDTPEASDSSPTNWSDIQYSMTYEQTHQNLGFLQNRASYTVAVKVASDAASDAVNGDCGSKNHFYFQLVFENGVSAYVQANQQLTADAFRAGQEETFQIYTNQNYGELTAVRIIPDDISDSSDIYDKLKIEEITVRKASNDALSQQWKIKNLENDGWVGIDYREEGTADSISGQAGRSQEELARTYRVTESSYAMNILFCVATSAYTNGNAQFQGTMTGTLNYYNRNGQLRSMNFDVVQAMYDYNNRAALSVEQNGNAQSDANLMFRGGHMDRFILSVDDVSRLVSLTFQPSTPVATQWNIESVTASLIDTGGVLRLNTNNEYERSGETEVLCQQTETKSPAYTVVVNANTTQQETVYFTEKEISVDTQNDSWTTVVSRLPSGTEDTLNLYVYLRDDADRTGYTLQAAAQYTNLYGIQYQAAAQDGLTAVPGEDGVFACTGLSVKGMSLLTGVTLEASERTASVYVDHVIVQRMRLGVVIGTYYLNFGGSNVGMYARTVAPTEQEAVVDQSQKVTLQLGEGTESTALLAENRDLAVSIKYTSIHDATDIEYDSPYIYLTDQNITSIREGQVVELTFSQPYVKEITGISLISTGNLPVRVDRGYVACYEKDAEDCTAWYSFAQGVSLSGTAHTLRPTDTELPTQDFAGRDGTVTDVTMTMTTAAADAMMESGIDGPVMLTVGYHPYDAAESTVRTTEPIADLRKYITSGGSAFSTGSIVTVRMLLSDVESLRWLELEPQQGTGSSSGWSLSKIAVDTVSGLRSSHLERSVNQRLYTGKTTRVGLSDVQVAITVNGETYINQNAPGVLAESGSSLTVGVQVTGASGQGFTATAAEIDLTSGAKRDANSYLTITDNELQFTPPENDRDANVTYRITVASEEQPDVCCTVDFTVQYEIKPEPLPEESGGGGGASDESDEAPPEESGGESSEASDAA